jgi:hypothetical protein
MAILSFLRFPSFDLLLIISGIRFALYSDKLPQWSDEHES